MDGKSFSFSFPFGIKSLLIASILTFNHWQSSTLVDACSDSYLYFLYATQDGHIKAVNKYSNAVVTVLEAQTSEIEGTSNKIGGITTKTRSDDVYYCSNKQIFLGDYFLGGDGKLLVDMDNEGSNGISADCSYIAFDSSPKRDGGEEDIFYVLDEESNIYYINNFDATVSKEEDVSKILPTKVTGLKLSPTLNEIEVHNGHIYYASYNTLVRATRKGHYIQLYQTDNEILSTALHPSESVIYYMEAGVGVWALNFKSMPFTPTLIYKSDKTTGITLSGDSTYTVEGRGPFAKHPNLYIFDTKSQVITAINMNTESTLSSESLAEGHEDIKIMMDINTVDGLIGNDYNANTDIPFISTFGMGCCTCEETIEPTPGPTLEPTSPTAYPTIHPTKLPTPQPSNHPTPNPTSLPTHRPSPNPTAFPTSFPTTFPTKVPTPHPTAFPTGLPTEHPTSTPSSFPTSLPTGLPTSTPTPAPTMHPTKHPTPYPTHFPTPSPTDSPTGLPTTIPTALPTSFPTTVPTSLPTTVPTSAPTQCDTVCYHELYELTDTFDMLQAKVTKLHAQEEEKLHRMLKETSLSINMHPSHNSMQQKLEQASTSTGETVNLESPEVSGGHSTITVLLTTFSSILVSFFVGTMIEKLRYRNRNLNSNLDRV